jgi:hypothetical protein
LFYSDGPTAVSVVTGVWQHVWLPLLSLSVMNCVVSCVLPLKECWGGILSSPTGDVRVNLCHVRGTLLIVTKSLL